MFGQRKTAMVSPDQALPGREAPIVSGLRHQVNGVSLHPPFPGGHETVQFGMGCFWGAERLFWSLPGVRVTAVGYSGGYTPNPSYEEVCSGQTGHAETVLVVYDPEKLGFEDLLARFWENHDPTQGMRQGNDRGTQYRSAIYTSTPAQEAAARASRERYQAGLDAAGRGRITTEVAPAGPFYYAEEYHQQYLHRNPMGYCGLQGTGVAAR